MDDLRGKVAVVTGAASGIGYALCEAFAVEGMRVAMADVDPAELDGAADRLGEKSGAEVLAVTTDVTSWDEVDALEARVLERFGGVHVLCNNAGVQLPGTTWEFTREECEWVLGVNLGGVVHGIRSFLPGMVERGEPGHVVNTASIGGLLCLPRTRDVHHREVRGGRDCRRASSRICVRARRRSASLSCAPAPRSARCARTAWSSPGGDTGRDIPLVTDVPRMPAADVAAQVVDAIRHDRFWILTHLSYNETIRARCRGIVGHRRPRRRW